jgi:hypothetical protein
MAGLGCESSGVGGTWTSLSNLGRESINTFFFRCPTLWLGGRKYGSFWGMPSMCGDLTGDHLILQPNWGYGVAQ